MLNIRKTFTWLFLLLANAVTPAVNAAEGAHYYLGLNGFHTDYSGALLNRASGGEVYMGVGVTNWVGIEYGVGSFGEFKNGHNHSKYVVHFSRLSLVASDQLSDRVHAFAKLGLLHTEQEFDPEQGEDDEGTGAGWHYQMGLYLPLNEHVFFQTSIQHSRFQFMTDTFKDVSMNSLGAGLHFKF